MHALQRDCLVVGGGAAGAALAWMLARHRVAVTLVDDGRAHYSGPYETVLAGTGEVWRRMGLLDAVHDGVRVDPLRHGAIWGGDDLTWRDDPTPGLLLQRGTFDRALRRAAATAGAHVYERTRAERVRDGWLCGDDLIAPRLTAVATGRRQGLAGLPPYRRGDRRTLAVTLRGQPDQQDRGTAVVEAVADGWLWSHCPQEGPASVAALLDARSGDGQSRAGQSRDGGLRERVDAMLAHAHGPAARLGAVEVVRANDASPRVRADGGDDLVLGDAAGTIDPLASQGVEKAVAAADHATAAILAALRRPDWWPRLRRLHALWERQLCALHDRTSAGFYERELRFSTQPFWRARRQQQDPPLLQHTQPVQWHADVEARHVLMRHGDGFAEVDGVTDVRRGSEVARIGRVPTAALWPLLRTHASIDDVTEQARMDPRLFVLSPRDVHDAVQWLYQQGWLVSDGPCAPAGH